MGRQRINKAVLCILTLMVILVFAACDEEEKPDITATASNNDFKVGVLYDGSRASGNYEAYAHELGIQKMHENLSLTDAQIVRQNIKKSTYALVRKSIENCIAQGCKVIFSTSQKFEKIVGKMAKKYPDVYFSQYLGSTNNHKNLNSYCGRTYQTQYLCGIVSGLKTTSNRVGYVLTQIDEENTSRDVKSFAIGLKEGSKSAKLLVYQVKEDTKENVTIAMNVLQQRRCDVVYQHLQSGYVMKEAANRHLFYCGDKVDMSKQDPSFHLVSAVWNYGIYYTNIVKDILNGSFQCDNYEGGLEDGLLDMISYTDNCPEGTKDQIEATKNQIIRGDVKALEKNDWTYNNVEMIIQ